MTLPGVRQRNSNSRPHNFLTQSQLPPKMFYNIDHSLVDLFD